MITTKVAIGAILGLGAIAVVVGQRLGVDWQSARGAAADKSFANSLGYLSPRELPDLVGLLPPPAPPGSPGMEKDEQARAAALLLKDSPLYRLAAADAVRAQANTIADFECAFGASIDIKRTPRLYQLLSRVRLDVRAASYPAKKHFARPRPFVLHNARSCYPDDEDMVRNDGSYPSARGAVGWAYGLLLAELRPQRAAEIDARARQFGQSRIICDQEWESDVEAAKLVASATLARERASPAFRADIDAARKEVAASVEARPSLDCKGEPIPIASR